ncbi:uncharacterized protein LOC110092589 [Dendrobium catenatum]|uniref:uncharacterized protein LOC110092589 n=1 Tax=Dendrobium catenatum TaxID=906689 RepID=UPI0009F242B2|nr:uncharacterized protein LOC110092589 [Dendrobium catenatum]
MSRMDLHDVGLVGPKFTWCNNKIGNALILERLDRYLLNSKALNEVHNAAVRHLERIASDHCPLILRIFNEKLHQRRFLRYEEVWASFLASKEIVLKNWSKTIKGDAMNVINVKCKRVLRALHYWSKAKLKNYMELKESLKKEISNLQLEESNGQGLSSEKLMLLRSKTHEFNVIMARVNTWWRQRAKVRRIQENYMNSKFFHSFANGRRMDNAIRQLRNVDGVLVEEQAEIEEVMMNFFKEKWKKRNCCLDA